MSRASSFTSRTIRRAGIFGQHFGLSTPEGTNATRVELEHRKFEQMGSEAGEKMRKDVDGGWPGLLEMSKQHAEDA